MSSTARAAALLVTILCGLAPWTTARAATPAVATEGPKAYAAFAQDKTRRDGFFPLLVDPRTAQVYLEVPRDRGEFIFQTSLPRGIGSNDLGIDRGQLGDTYLVRFERIGTRMLLQARNTDYRADSDSAAERAAVEEAFATSVLAGFEVVADDDERAVIDYTPFLLTDRHGIAHRLADREEGTFEVDPQRSAPWAPRTRAFPRNTELEALLTLTGTATGPLLKTVAPQADAVTVHAHHSLIALPPAGYETRAFHPFSGFGAHAWVDYAQDLDADIVRRVVPRHRLEKRDPDAARSPAVEPIVYYLDPGVPEPVRSALLEGASWWNQAFEAIGYVDAFQVRMLPDDADPMDVRYNVIQWVHRSTRGWSYGSSVRDPRTGEILKGHVTLGSLRVRQDLLIARALTAPYRTPADADALGALDAMALARIRQLAAHEVGHTLGLSHNFAASAVPGGTSVMDYPHPRVGLDDDGRVALAGAYDVGLGPWDLHAIAYGYTQLPAAAEAAALKALVDGTRARGLRFVSDRDARAVDGAHPLAHLWDNGTDAGAELRRLLRVREGALAQFGAAALRDGEPYSDLEALLVPLYYLHRYQVEATAKLVGGLDYRYALAGDGADATTTMLPAATQREALAALLETLDADVLGLDERLLALLPPQAHGHRRTRESPPGRTGLTFDAVTAAEAAAEHSLTLLLDPARLARVAQQHARDADIPGVEDLLDGIVAKTLPPRFGAGLEGEIRRRLAHLTVEHLLVLAWTDVAVPEVASRARAHSADLEIELRKRRDDQALALAETIARARDDGTYGRRGKVAQLPPGSPI
ncbi:MAG TPA: zinc-dependent metalloprotease [Pseudomonadales bacterium]|nr:zinc-dependent metalloprotease [Pseudomonadales bacterium]